MNVATGRNEAVREQFARLAREHEAFLMQRATRLCNGDTDWAKDLVQDALISGYAAFREGQFVEGSFAKAWLARILTNRFINEYKRKKKWDSGVDFSLLEDKTSGEADSPDSSLLASMLDKPLLAALNKLPEAQRLCVLFVDVEQLEYAEAARILEVPVGTVRSRLARARLELYKLLLPYARSRRII